MYLVDRLCDAEDLLVLRQHFLDEVLEVPEAINYGAAARLGKGRGKVRNNESSSNSGIGLLSVSGQTTYRKLPFLKGEI